MAEVLELCTQAYATMDARDRAASRWVMSRPWYDQLRAEACTEDQETMRAKAHTRVLVNATDPWPHTCPACGGGLFATMGDLAAHVAAMADPASREPGHGDTLFGVTMEVREDGGKPHLETGSV
jgi:hypothetical protein